MRYLVAALLLSFSTLSPVFADPAATLIINEIRKEKRRKAIRYSPQLEAVAAAHANYVASQSYISHTGATGLSIGDRTAAQGVLCGRKYRTWSAQPRRRDGGLESIQRALQEHDP